MNIRITTLAIFSIVALGSAIMPANAQEGGGAAGARFHFQPNRYGTEKSNSPGQKYYSGPVSSAHSGSVPRGPGFLGINPQDLVRPPAPAPAPAPMAQTTVAATPSFTQAVPKFVPQAFSAKFGSPLTPPVVAQLAPPAGPLTAQHVSPPKSEPATQPSPRVSTDTSIKWRAPHHPRPVARVAGPALALTKPVASYGGMGYQSGPTVPTASGSGMSSSTAVKAVLVRH